MPDGKGREKKSLFIFWRLKTKRLLARRAFTKPRKGNGKETRNRNVAVFPLSDSHFAENYPRIITRTLYLYLFHKEALLHFSAERCVDTLLENKKALRTPTIVRKCKNVNESSAVTVAIGPF